MSILAGFVEPGESAEQAVAREVLEETGISVGQVRYLASQPWPMPHSLMLGFSAQAPGGQEIRVDEEEIAEAGWYSREDVRASMTRARCCCHRRCRSRTGSSSPGTGRNFPAPGDGQRRRALLACLRRGRLGPPSPERNGRQSGKVGHLLDRVAEEVVTWIDNADELAEQLEADHAEELRPGDQAAENYLARDRRRDGRRERRGLLGELRVTTADPRPPRR